MILLWANTVSPWIDVRGMELITIREIVARYENNGKKRINFAP